MPNRRNRKGEEGQSKEQLDRHMRRNKLKLFIEQFEKEAQERMNELEAKHENLLATVDKVFEVELMKIPLSIQNTRICDLLAEEASASDLSIASLWTWNETCENPQLLKGTPSERVNSADSTPVQSILGRTTSKTGKAPKRTRALVSSHSAGHLTGTLVGSKSRRVLLNHPNQTRAKLRSVVSVGDMHCAIDGAAAQVTVTTAQGQTLSFSEETNDINCDLLDDVAWCQIQKLATLLKHLSQRRSKETTSLNPDVGPTGI